MLALGLAFGATLSATAFERTPVGIQVEAAGQTVRLEVFSDSIIRVLAGPVGVESRNVSYAVVEENRVPTLWTVTEDETSVTLKTASVHARIDRDSGRVSFHDSEGKLLLEELPGGRTFRPVVELGEQTFRVQQRFDLGNVRAIHGLGAQQDGIANYKGRDAFLKQYNVVDVNPFFLTDRGWGMLWDNNSMTRFGDPRPYQELDTLQLHNAEGERGGLTATYFSKPDFSETFTTREESIIAYEFLPDIERAPEGFDLETGSVRWEGSIEAHEPGLHKFELYGSSYTKLWIDGELLVDRWRVNWMPWTNRFEVNLQPGEPRSIKIEWNANAGYNALKVLPPAPPELKEQIVFTSDVGEAVDYYFVHGGDADGVLAGYRRLTGEAPMMPKWSLGKFQSRERYKTQDELLDVMREFRQREIPLDVIVLDWSYWPQDGWGSHDMDLERFPDAAEMNREIHEEHNARIMISIWPKFYVGTEHYEVMDRHGWLYRRNVESGDLDWIGDGYLSTFYDAFNPEAGAYFWEGINKKLFSKGFDAWWLDATEPDMHSNISVEERKWRMHPTATGSGARNFNAYSINNARPVYEGQRAEDPDRRVFILTRSSFAGQQRYAAASWTGDVSSRWEDLAKQIPAGINFAAAGIPWWTTDIGGFCVEPRFEDPNEADLAEWRELNMRWYQFGSFSPLFRVHGQFPYREAWNIAPEGHPVYEGMLKYNQLRYRLMPWLYSLAGAVTHDAGLIMRPLLMDFPDDEKVYDIDDQFMHGPAFLVSPVTTYEARQREVYLPAGTSWYDFHTGQCHTGGQTLTADAPLTDMPLYVKAGSILLFGPDLQYVDEKPADTIEIRIYPGADGSFVLYEDAGTDYTYEEGAFSRIPLTWKDSSRTLTIGERHGRYPEMLEKRTFHIVDASSHRGSGFEHTASPEHSVIYDGEAVEIHF